jgi:HEAT repeat protein
LEPLGLGIVVASTAVMLVAFWRSELRHHRRRRQDWRQLLEQVGAASITDLSGASSLRLDAELEGRGFSVHDFNRSKSDRGTAVVVASSSSVALRRESIGTALDRVLGRSEIELGDREFDKAVRIEGPVEEVRAVLDIGTRGIVRSFLEGVFRPAEGVQVSAWTIVIDGNARAEFSTFEGALRQGFEPILHSLVDVARRLDRPADLLGRLAANTRSEPEWRVRLENIALLAEGYRGQPAIRDVLLQCCQDPHRELRLRAAQALGSEGHEALLRIATDPEAEAYAARALSALGEHLPLERGLEILGTALRKRHVETARACLQALGKVGGAAVVEPLARVLAVEHGELSPAAARALGQSGAPEAEAPLLRFLALDSGERGAAAAEALGHVGSAAAVLPLQEAAARQGADEALRRSARQAIAHIQSRLQGATPGQLSLTEGEAGQVSLAGEDPAGRVSLPIPPER